MLTKDYDIWINAGGCGKGCVMDKSALISELTADEGLRLKPYECTAGKLTIGIGRNIEDKGISKKEAEYLLNNDIDEVISQLDAKLPWWRNMTDARQRVLCNMCFNLGISGLLYFKNTLASMQARKYDDAAKGMLSSLWAKQVGARAQRLAKMMREG